MSMGHHAEVWLGWKVTSEKVTETRYDEMTGDPYQKHVSDNFLVAGEVVKNIPVEDQDDYDWWDEFDRISVKGERYESAISIDEDDGDVVIVVGKQINYCDYQHYEGISKCSSVHLPPINNVHPDLFLNFYYS